MKLTNTSLHLRRIPGLNDGAVGIPVRIVAVLKVESVGALVLCALDAVPFPTSRSLGWWLTRAR